MTADTSANDLDCQITALTEIVGALAATVSQLNARVDRLTSANRPGDRGDRGDGHDEEPENHDPAAWVWFTPPAAAEEDPDIDGDPRITVDNFVTWYNVTYVGVEGSRAKPIPDCWRQHPGLAMEVANLAYSWRAANMGQPANVREAQYWHHQTRPGFTDRLAREWAHTECLDGEHRAAGAHERPDQFTLAEQLHPVGDGV
ncbi:MAG TPA: hypothetical protein VHH53_04150 [Pseudonocardiaceae bacterium]|nr:hypothetical protein [Pseudonocardiaceae bacterium]